MDSMEDRKLLRTGGAGTVIAAICCFTPALVLLFGAMGLSAWVGWLDYVLWPALVIFAGFVGAWSFRRYQMETSNLPQLREHFNQARDSVKVLTILSPT